MVSRFTANGATGRLPRCSRTAGGPGRRVLAYLVVRPLSCADDVRGRRAGGRSDGGPGESRSPDVPTPLPRGLPQLEVEPAFPNISLQRMVHLTYSSDTDDRLFVVLQPGQIVFFEDRPDAAEVRTFMDIRERVSDRGNEEGCSDSPSTRRTSRTATSTSTTRPRTPDAP